MKKQYKKGISLMEMIVWLLVLTLVSAFSVPLISKKVMYKADITSHGVYVCFWKDGKLWEEQYSGRKHHLVFSRETKKCIFSPPKKSALYQVTAIGGGGGGGDAGYGGGFRVSNWKLDQTISPLVDLNKEILADKNINIDEFFGRNGFKKDYSGNIYFIAKGAYGTKSEDFLYNSSSVTSNGPIDCEYSEPCNCVTTCH